MADAFPPLFLNPNAERRLRAGHVWIYSNEIDNARSPLKQFESGQQVMVHSSNGKAVGIAYINPHTLISARLISRDHPLDKSLLVHRIKIALALRERLFAEPYYRLIYGDSDGLSGLVVDRFGDYLVVQINTAGMERVLDDIVTALCQVLKPQGILLKNDSRVRASEELPEYVKVAFGEVPEQVELIENGCRFAAPVYHGQKTGWFYDHRNARARLAAYSKGRRVLDVFSYIGGWGIQAALGGASEVTLLDSSASALQLAQHNAELNGVGDKVKTLEGSAFDVLKNLHDAEERFDTIILDPPAFIPRRKDIRAGETAYRRINELAIRLLNRDGFLISASCSLHLTRNSLTDILRASARHLDRQLQILEQHGQGADHPVHPAIAETDYLKSVF
ncbi:MAG TPA: class I SAM-dependent rRNA methyltransferase, partial [Spongiibacteraceae bacterium]|nr:class I SAM-dependent rRNA methyltransferase [Spongiibacteraceae bacterium]